MTLEIRCNGQDLAPLLNSPPKITDQLNSVCRTLDFTAYQAQGLDNFLGQPVEMWLNGVRWFFGFMLVRGVTETGEITYRVYDPLYYLKRNPDDYYFKNQTLTQGFRAVCKSVGIGVSKVADTGVVLPPLLYPKADGDKIIIDMAVRTIQATGRKFWFRFDPDVANFGATLFERAVPAKLWAFQRGVNLISSRYEESAEDVYNIIKLVERESGKTVVRSDTASVRQYGAMTYFDEVDKDKKATMETTAATLLTKLKGIKATITLEGINTGIMPQLYSGDVVYVEEKISGVLGAYHITNVTHTPLSKGAISLALDVQKAPDIPDLEYESAADAPKKKKSSSTGKGVQQTYGPEMLAVIDKYDIN